MRCRDRLRSTVLRARSGLGPTRPPCVLRRLRDNTSPSRGIGDDRKVAAIDLFYRIRVEPSCGHNMIWQNGVIGQTPWLSVASEAQQPYPGAGGSGQISRWAPHDGIPRISFVGQPCLTQREFESMSGRGPRRRLPDAQGMSA